MNYNPPIKERQTEELIIIANSSTDNWQQGAIEEAKNELSNRGITIEMQNEVIESWKNEFKKQEEIYQKQLVLNETEGYSYFKMGLIFLMAPFILAYPHFINTGLSLSELKSENFRLKYRQRLYLLVSGVIFWFCFVYGTFQYSQSQRLKEIEKVDISTWEKENGMSQDTTTPNPDPSIK